LLAAEAVAVLLLQVKMEVAEVQEVVSILVMEELVRVQK
jgi:hypothetical protein